MYTNKDTKISYDWLLSVVEGTKGSGSTTLIVVKSIDEVVRLLESFGGELMGYHAPSTVPSVLIDLEGSWFHVIDIDKVNKMMEVEEDPRWALHYCCAFNYDSVYEEEGVVIDEENRKYLSTRIKGVDTPA